MSAIIPVSAVITLLHKSRFRLVSDCTAETLMEVFITFSSTSLHWCPLWYAQKSAARDLTCIKSDPISSLKILLLTYQNFSSPTPHPRLRILLIKSCSRVPTESLQSLCGDCSPLGFVTPRLWKFQQVVKMSPVHEVFCLKTLWVLKKICYKHHVLSENLYKLKIKDKCKEGVRLLK